MDSNKLKVILVVIFAAFAAVYLGIAAATAQLEAIAWVLGGTLSVIVLALGRHVWMLIPLTVGLGGTINAFPGSPPPWALAGFLAGSVLLLRILMRKTHEFQVKISLLDFAVFLNATVIFQAYVRNPTGLMLMGGDLVGGKPYFVFTAAIGCYFLMSIVKTDYKFIKISIYLTLLGAVIDGLFKIITQMIPGIGARVLPIYSGVTARTAMSGAEFDFGVSRLEGGKDAGSPLLNLVFGLFRPIRAINPLFFRAFILAATGGILIILSGFRSIIAYALLMFIAGTLLRRKSMDLLLLCALGFLGLVMIAASGLATKLPSSAQRVLAPIPFIEIDPFIRQAAEGSGSDRFEMWRLALFTDRYIKNKWLGDGFAYSAEEQRAKMEIALGGPRTFSKGFGFIESSLASGSYHGFHVETIRFTGGIGLASALFLMIVCAVKAWNIASKYRNQPEFGPLAILAIPFLVYPIQALLIFGAYRAHFPQFIVLAGLLKILENHMLNKKKGTA
jgi:hypothetical protein